MSAIIEQVLQLPREEKLELLHALQDDLQWEEETLEEGDLSKEEWAEIYRRERMLESGETGVMTLDEFKQKLNAFQHDV